VLVLAVALSRRGGIVCNADRHTKEAAMTNQNDRAHANEDVARIRELIEAWRQAVLAKDVDALVSHYAPDVVVFDVVPPASIRGVEHYRENWRRWFDSMKGPLAFEMREVEVAASGDLAYAHTVNRVAVGEQEDIVRATVCFRKIDGDWRVVHEHASVPLVMDMDPDEKS
jgi:uncharacterized protein (TIGR02246 family)